MLLCPIIADDGGDAALCPCARACSRCGACPFAAETVAQEISGLGLPVIEVASAAPSRQAYLLRPDLGRRLDPASERLLAAGAGDPVDVALVIGDGLSLSAVHAHGAAMVAALQPHIVWER